MRHRGNPNPPPQPPPSQPHLSPPALEKLHDDASQAPAALQNYFTNRTIHLPLTWWLLRSLLLPFILLRALILILSFSALFFFSFLVTLGLSSKEYRPLTGFRGTLVTLLVRPWLRVMLWSLGFWWVEEVGTLDFSTPRCYISNHINGLPDALYLLWRTRAGGLPAEKSNFPPLLSCIVQALSLLTFDRSNPVGVKDMIVKAMRDRTSPPLLIFPEGCCSNGTRLLFCFPGATAAMEVVQPCVIQYPSTSLDVSWTLNGPSLPSLVLRMLFSPRLRMVVHYLPPQGPPSSTTTGGTGGTTGNPREFMEALRVAMGKAGKLPLVPWGSEDVRLAAEAMKGGGSAEVGLVNFDELRLLVDLSPPPQASKEQRDAVKTIMKAFLGELRGGMGGGGGRGGKRGGGVKGGAGSGAGAGVSGASTTTIDYPQFKHMLLTLRASKKAALLSSGGRGGGKGGAGSLPDEPASPISFILSGQSGRGGAAPPPPSPSSFSSPAGGAAASATTSSSSDLALEDMLVRRLFHVSVGYLGRNFLLCLPSSPPPPLPSPPPLNPHPTPLFFLSPAHGCEWRRTVRVA